ncbi:hypothetical protein H257_04168 [Aphanomyces astaci]|uniref:Uncharacterized protein n=1 Tax=Aphanomyces astaci TaxID=112090 RepID=W4GVU4_APHAT|nr:hypothetical protein H257_04168 [Aphanomyces astaci]ETV83441.1 hypothetical protein H257_04168 [Aphanomyces astaci]|eukprot:XP_009826871.1 hypothetical protein H257_04168 [Aphanomyces astaci]
MSPVTSLELAPLACAHPLAVAAHQAVNARAAATLRMNPDTRARQSLPHVSGVASSDQDGCAQLSPAQKSVVGRKT